ncbi:hypothetical protein LSH36_532g01044 [Paralvinella palmiformis]|uniref:Magnesium-dependent phosphatase 1 n=1 Tax=Paralvinella palmiformis TaxID=53620 RepID=A0AAD9MWA5_9ANNE|nr:hypothetical protein LSH36_532g01044 [Paralvinella palmiformis]
MSLLMKLLNAPRGNNVVTDNDDSKVEYFPDVPKILHKLKKDGFLLGVASRTSCIEEAKELIHLFKWDGYFDYVEIYPGTKTSHFNNFLAKSGVPYKDMLFFDDESRNITDVSQLGVTCIHTPDGMSLSLLQEGLAKFNKR